jgi:hypothetical protein
MRFGMGTALYGRRRGSLRSLVARIEEQVAARPAALRTLDQLAVDPDQVMTRAHLPQDAWQHQVLASTMVQILLLCSRQAGKSTVAAALAVRAPLLQRDALVLVLGPSLHQSGELFRKAPAHLNALGRPVPVHSELALRTEFANESRVVSLPGDEGTIRGFSGVTLLIIDEAARVMDDLYAGTTIVADVTPGGTGPLSWRRISSVSWEAQKTILPMLRRTTRASSARRATRSLFTAAIRISPAGPPSEITPP